MSDEEKESQPTAEAGPEPELDDVSHPEYKSREPDDGTVRTK
jgi:hypothetical protein